MSINHYSSDIPETSTLWWSQQRQAILMKPMQNPSTSGPPIHPSWPSHLYHLHQPCLNSHTPRFNLNQDEEEDDDDDNNGQPPLDDLATSSRSPEGEDEKEAMFEKPLTPSDVGKLNRLVIPKQHAEKYFPLADSGESKGLSLSFEDESGKCWRFRYSYWNSSQSYVLTKGWSRYVKEKRLDAGDVVFFERHRADAQRLFINWRRRQQSGSAPAHVSRAVAAAGVHNTSNDGNSNNNINNRVAGIDEGWTRGFYSAHPYPTHQPLPYQPHCLHAGGRVSQAENKTTPAGNSSSSRVLRLFGVNMECQTNESGSSRPEFSFVESTQGTATQHQFYHYHHQPCYSSNPPHHTDVNQMRDRQG